MSDLPSTRPSMRKSWRLTLGTWMFYVPFVLFLGAPVVIPLIGLSATQATALVGGILVAAEVIWFASIPLLGKEGFKQMKSQAFSLLKPNTGPISRIRHQTGAWMFTVGILSQVGLGVTVMMVYFFVGGKDPEIPIMGLSFEEQALLYVYLQIAAMACMVASVYVLGADFWERLNHAFEWPKQGKDDSF